MGLADGAAVLEGRVYAVWLEAELLRHTLHEIGVAAAVGGYGEDADADGAVIAKEDPVGLRVRVRVWRERAGEW